MRRWPAQRPTLPPMRRERRPAREMLDDFYPTVVRYVGLGLTVVLVIATITLAAIGNTATAVALAPGYVAAAGCVFFKWVHDANKRNGRDD